MYKKELHKKVKTAVYQKKKLTHGELLKRIIEWYGHGDEAFAQLPLINKTRGWVTKNKLAEKIMMKNRYAICSQFNIPMSFWDGEYELPLRFTDAAIQVEVKYNLLIDEKNEEINKMKAEISNLKEQLLETLKRNNDLHQRLDFIKK